MLWKTSASLFSLPGIYALDNYSLLVIAQFQIDFVILSQSAYLQLPILLTQWTAVVLSESTFISDSQIWSYNDLSQQRIVLSSKTLMCMRVSVMLNWSLLWVFLKTAPKPIVDASVVIVNKGFSILIVLNDPIILFFHQIYLPRESIEVFLLKLSLIIFIAFLFRRFRSR